MDKLKMHTPNLTQDNIARIRELFPNCVTEAKDDKGQLKLAIDFDQLKQELSDSIVEGPQERYHLNWPGKREAMLTANAPIAKTLRPCREESVDFDTTKNLFVEGDNLDALKLLQETYLGKVKMIYIDPPYNTGNDFIYEDDFAEDAEEFLVKSNQKDEQGNRLVANTEANGRFHSDWLSMMYSRLKLARNILTDDGVVFISIDDHEVANLIELANEVFGTDNFIGSLAWLKKRKGSFLSKTIVSVTEWLLAYGNSKSVKLFGGVADSTESQPLIKRTNSIGILNFPANKVKTKLPDGNYVSGVYGEGSSAVELLNDFAVNSGIITSAFTLRGPFIWGQDYLDNQLKNGAELIINTQSLQVRAYKANDPESYKGISSFINGIELSATNEDGYEQLRAIMAAENIMSYPKPVNYIKHILAASTNWDKNSIALDFFAGSSTTAHAVMQLNAEDGGKRQFIMVQLPEPCDEKSEAFKAGYKNIAEISKERIRRAGKKIKEEHGLTAQALDIGFRVLKVDTSNMADVYYTPDAIKQDLVSGMMDNIKPDRTPEDLLFQVLLDWGVDLTLPISQKVIQGRTVFFVNQPPYDLVACFDAGVTEALIKELAGHKPLRVVFRDSSFASDSVKINAEQIFKQLSPGTEVRSI